MNAEALIGTVLGTCTLQKVIGQGEMGAVYLAQQSRPHRQVAVKVLMPMAPLTSTRLAAFLERFRRETDAAASLEHPHIVPVHEYGEQDGLVYLVMAYVAGGTLRDEMEREGQLPLSKVVDYLEQMASALDFAHERGVIHRNIKPTNILITPAGRLLLTDFGLVNIAATAQTQQVSQTGTTLPTGLSDYMAPEQVTGDSVDGRTDLYALGAVLYLMLTGATPFQQGTLQQISARHFHMPPPSPRLLRPELPVAAEQVVLRCLARRPSDRYNHAQDLANAFRVALESADIPIGYSQASLLFPEGATRSFKPSSRGLFDPSRQVSGKERSFPAPVALNAIPTTPPIGTIDATPRPAPEIPERPERAGPVVEQPARPGLGLRTSLRRLDNEAEIMPPPTAESGSNGNGKTPLPALTSPESSPPASAPISPTVTDIPQLAFPIEKNPTMTAGKVPFSAAAPSRGEQSATDGGSVTRTLPGNNITRPLFDAGAVTEAKRDGGSANTMKLTGAVKVVKVPVAGQPGRYVTGLLPVTPETKTTGSLQNSVEKGTADGPQLAVQGFRKQFDDLDRRTKVVAVLLAALLILSTSLLWLAHAHSPQVAGQPTKHVNSTPNLTATTAARAAQATATADANIILADPLSQNIHNWLISTSGTRIYVFKDGAYHITDNDDSQSAPALLQDMPPSILHAPLSYSLTMEEIRGDDTSINNSFGLIFRFSTMKADGKLVTTFYTFEVANTAGGEYQFWKYDDQYASSTVTPWTKIWHQNSGSEFHKGHGSRSINTFKVFMNGSNFTFYVNGKKVGSSRDNTIASGQVGMLVNLKGTEVAFTNFLLAYH